MSNYYPVAYTYNADTYCPACIVSVLQENLSETAYGFVTPSDSTEDKLNAIAQELGINREDERSFDSGEFPKVVFEDSETDTPEHCGNGPHCLALKDDDLAPQEVTE